MNWQYLMSGNATFYRDIFALVPPPPLPNPPSPSPPPARYTPTETKYMPFHKINMYNYYTSFHIS